MGADSGRVLALDLGSSSVRAVVLAVRDGGLAAVPGATARAGARLHQDADGAAELDVEEYLGAAVSCLDKLAGDGALRDVGTVAVSTQWHSLLGLDERGRPVGPCLSWMDLRPAAPAGHGPADPDGYHARTGAWWHPFYWPVRIGWLRRQGVAARRWVGLPEHLGAVLWGDASASVSSASGTGALDTAACRWDDEALALAGVDARAVPELADDDWSGRLTGEYRRRWPDLAGARIAPPLGDGAASTLGSGCAGPDRLAVTVGTSAAVRLVDDGAAAPAPGVWRYRVDRRRAVYGVAYSGGGVLDEWMIHLLGVDHHDRRVDEAALSAVPPGGHGLACLPYHAGHRPPAADPTGHGGTLYGLRLTTTPADVVAATMEGLCHEITAGADAVDPAGAALPVLGGGAVAASDWLSRRLAAALGGTARRVTDAEVGACGAAAAALGIDHQPAGGDVSAPDDEVVAMAAARDRHRELARRLDAPPA